ncbi:MAG: NAD-dependent epimerase [Gammaproteobacteria bacterium]|jgi:UDP-glucuronate 4-epimerase|nr:NAD-dependent epimerase [Gammaproteobacteria bacterium]
MKILVTGAAGFIGAALCRRLLERGDEVVGIDNLNDYYDVQLKKDRLATIESASNFQFLKLDISDRDEMSKLFQSHKPERVVHLAAQAGVRYSIENPNAYVDANLVGFVNILEGCRNNDVEHLIYASSSSVYGANIRTPFSVTHNVDHPLSLYGATKKANELMAHTYSHLYQLPSTGLRFFTVYGPWGRPDMSPFLFVSKIINEEPIQVFNEGNHMRDFTYIDDVTRGIERAIDNIPYADKNWDPDSPNPNTSSAPYRVYNIGNQRPVKLLEYIKVIEKCVGKESIKEFLPQQAGDVIATHADISESTSDLGYGPTTILEKGMSAFVSWYKSYYKIV